MDLTNMVLRGIITLILLAIYSFFYYRSANREVFNKAVLFLHLIVLSLFFTGNLELPYFLFDILWWSMTGVGIISSIDLIRKRKKWMYLLVPTTFVFMIFIYPMLLLENM